MDTMLSDLRFAVRALLARPGFSALAVLTLAIGIGVNAVAFSAINALLFKPFRFPGVETLGWVVTRSAGNPYNQSSLPDYEDLAKNTRSFESLAAEGRMPLSLQDGSNARQVWGLFVSANYFSTLRVIPEIGRPLGTADRVTDDIPVMVSSRFWSEQMGGGSSVAGRTLTLNGRIASVIGVLPDTFQGPGGLFEPDLWVPFDAMRVLGMPSRLFDRSEHWLTVVGRLRPGVTTAQAASDLQNVARVLDPPATNDGKARTMGFAPMAEGAPELRSIARFAWIALAIVGIVLLIACFNVAALLLARAADRRREIGVRTALGASRARIMRQFAFEGLILAMVSGVAAVVVAGWSADLLAAFSLPSPIPQRLHIAVDRRLIAFTALLVVCAGVLPTLLPALQSTRGNLVASMRMDNLLGARRARLRSALMIAQIAGSTLFLTAALLFVRSFLTQAQSSPGFEAGHLAALELKPSDYGYDAPRARAFFDSLLERVRTMPGVNRAAIGDRIPFYVGFPKVTKVAADGSDCATIACPNVFVYGIGDGYLSALGVPLIAGSEPTAREIAAADSIVVSQKLASRLWPGKSGVGEWIRDARSAAPLRVVGVAADVTHNRFGEAARDVVYRPLLPGEFSDSVTLVVRTSGDPEDLLGGVQSHVRALDASLPTGTAKTMARRMDMPLWPARTAAGFLGVCGTLALALATVGLFGMTYLTVSQRTREFGVRAALGATPGRVMTLVLREGVSLILPGVMLGLVGAAITGRLAASALFGVNPGDPSTYALSALLQSVVAIAACLLPAYRATKADPMLALRADS
jgi:predicted permease